MLWFHDFLSAHTNACTFIGSLSHKKIIILYFLTCKLAMHLGYPCSEYWSVFSFLLFSFLFLFRFFFPFFPFLNLKFCFTVVITQHDICSFNRCLSGQYNIVIYRHNVGHWISELALLQLYTCRLATPHFPLPFFSFSRDISTEWIFHNLFHYFCIDDVLCFQGFFFFFFIFTKIVATIILVFIIMHWYFSFCRIEFPKGNCLSRRYVYFGCW